MKLNVKWDRSGHAFAGAYREIICLDDASVEQQLVYSVTNTVKDGLVEMVQDSPYFNTYRSQARGEKACYFRIDWDAYRLAGSARKKSHCPQDFLKWLELEVTPIPGQEDWPEHKRQSWIRAQVREIEKKIKEKLEEEGRTPMGVEAQFKTDPRSRPKNRKIRTPQPPCHCSDPELAIEYKQQRKATLTEYRAASIDYRSGKWKREFPEGTYRPPIISPFLASQT